MTTDSTCCHFRLLVPCLVLAALTACSRDSNSLTQVANPDSYTVNSGQTLTVNAPGVLANDDGDGALQAILISPPAHHVGSFKLNADGSFVYVHDGSGATSDNFIYRALDGSENLGNVTVTITINQAPLANNACVSVVVGTPTLMLKLPASDPNSGDKLSYMPGSVQPTKGTVNIDIAGNYVYTPNTNLPSGDGEARGVDTFSYEVTDSHGLQSGEGVVAVLIDDASALASGPGRVRIMPLGDSITDGVTIASSELPPLGQRVSYRRKLYADLEAVSPNYGIDFVGSLSEGTAAIPPIGDPDNEGHPGWCDDNNPFCNAASGNTIADHVIGFLNANPADIILLHIGTNAFDTDPSGVSTILDNISTWAEANYPVTVLVARIIPRTDGSADVSTFNDRVQSIAYDRSKVKVYIVDQQAELSLSSDLNTADPSLMADNLHPNQSGYDKMADKWLADLADPAKVARDYPGLPECTP